jgi:hypothetical protein
VTLRPSFFRHGLGLGLHEAGQLKVADAVAVSLRVPEDKSLLVQVIPKGAKDENTKIPALVQPAAQSGYDDIVVAFPKSGVYFVRVFTAKRGTVGSGWDYALEYQVEARAAAKGGELPTAYTLFQDQRCRLHGPFTAALKAGAPQEFKLAVPGASKVVVNTGGKSLPLEEREGVFVGEVVPVAGEVAVAASFPDQPGTFKRLLKYEAK